MPVAALLLTGGSSRRMGRDKATLPGPDGRTLAVRTQALLGEVADPVLEVGPGHAGGRTVVDTRLGAGPLAAVASGVEALTAMAWDGPVLVVATDLPGLHPALLAWLAGHGAPGPVIPLVDGRRQLLCARYDAVTLRRTEHLVASGCRRMSSLVEGRDVHLAGADEWLPISSAEAWRDVDTPADLVAAQELWARRDGAEVVG